MVVYGQAYQQEFPSVPIDGLRGERILTALVREGLVGREAVVRPTVAAHVKLARVHTPEYLAQLSSPDVLEATFGLTPPPHLAERVVELQRAMVGGTLLAARAARHQHKLVINLGGGFHHAHADRGRGFCLLNDIAIAIAELRAKEFDGPIAVVDLDLHDGDGTRALFADDPTVWTFSIHNDHWGPTEAVSSTAIALGPDVEDAAYLEALREHLPPMLDRHRPGLVFYLAGCDPAADDGLGNWAISDDGMLARDRFVLDSLGARGIRSAVWLLGGGYGGDAWRHTARGLIAGLGGPERPHVPSTQSITLSRYRHLAGVLDPAELSGEPPGELRFDERDLLGATGPAFTSDGTPKVLGYYTPRGVEVGLEGYGLLGRLRALGFEPRLEIDVDADAGDTVRVFGDAGSDCLLMEIRMRKDARTVPGLELLRIEWLLLQNPHASFTAGRVALPGQRHPGLRMFDDVSILTLMTCERLRLDGIVVVPSHFHVAVRWHGRMRFVDPVAEGRFRALATLLEPLRLEEAVAALELGRVIDSETGEAVTYTPAAMVLPATDALSRRFDDAWQAEVERARAAASLELTPQP